MMLPFDVDEVRSLLNDPDLPADLKTNFRVGSIKILISFPYTPPQTAAGRRDAGASPSQA
jgi:hypothetical protein